jgi:hypothetical protein
MRLLTPSQKKLSSRQLSTAAENITAAQFAMCGFDVLEQGTGARYFYDLGVANSGGMMKLTVHGSFRGFWNLVDPFFGKAAQNLTRVDYHRAIDKWLDRQGHEVTFCLVQFESADLTLMPRIYLASAVEIATRLHDSVEQLGDTALYEQYEGEDSTGRHCVETLPSRWRFSQERIAELMDRAERKPARDFRFSESAVCTVCATSDPASCVHCLPMMN